MKSLMAVTAAILAVAYPNPIDAGSASKAKAYPLKTCIVADNELGSMGSPVSKVHEGQTVKFCCKSCVKDFSANPNKFLQKLNKK